MIGPHEGKELELMLAGEKPLAVFHDEIPPDGQISEEIIPEAAFTPHVRAGTIKRFAQDIPNINKGGVIRFICFTLPGEEWRAQFFLWFKKEFFSNHIAHDRAHDEIIGNLLGYSDSDIKDYLLRSF